MEASRDSKGLQSDKSAWKEVPRDHKAYVSSLMKQRKRGDESGGELGHVL